MNPVNTMARNERQVARGATNARRWPAYIVQGGVLLFLLFDALPKIAQMDFVVEASADLGYSATKISIIGGVLLACTILYAIPRTAVLGAVLLTGYLGGAVATNVIAEEGMFYFPVIFGALVWLGLYLRDAERLQPIIPWQRA